MADPVDAGDRREPSWLGYDDGRPPSRGAAVVAPLSAEAVTGFEPV
ncbi:hypothetical protein ACTMTU_23630 [Streptomyces sp. OZ13]